MISSDELLKPLQTFNRAMSEHDQITADYFDDLVKKSGINTAENTVTVEKYKKKLAIFDNQNKRLSKFKGLRAFLIVLAVLALLAGIILLVLGITGTLSSTIGIISISVGGALAIFFIVLICIGPNKRIKELKSGLSILKKELEELKDEGYAQCAALNRLFEYDMQIDIMNKTFDSIHFHKTLAPDQLQMFIENYGDIENRGNDSSTVHVISGDIIGNPFVIETSHIMKMGNYIYTGTLTITYPVRVSNGKGGYTTTMRTQILTASVTKPKPLYNYEKVIYFGNDIARALCFSRKPSGMSGKSDKEINKYVKSEYKKFTDKSRKDLAKGFTALGNEQFEALFHAIDRNNEVGFRTLFTPLAQQNFVAQIKNNDPYGDDFIFKKVKTLNILRNEHNQYVDYVGNPLDFVDFDYQNAREKFVNFNRTFFKSVYFDLMPILNIPSYQQLAKNNTFSKKYRGNNTIFEIETLANLLDKSYFKPEHCATDIILKAHHISKEGTRGDYVKITAHGHSTIEHIDLVPTLGGDGLMHPVPVHWLEYVPIEKDTYMTVIKKEQTRADFMQKQRMPNYQDLLNRIIDKNAITYYRGNYAVINNGDKPLLKEDLDILRN